jgi:hypothetical protein
MKNIFLSIFFLISVVINTKAQISATFIGDTVKIWDANFDWSCSGRFFPITRTSQDTIYIIECDSMQLVTCSCYFTVSTSLSGLNAGTYTAVVTRQHQEHIEFPKDTIHIFNTYAGSVTFTISNPPSLSPHVSLYQSDCSSSPESVPEENTFPNKFAMLVNYPNPFNPNTIIRYTIPNTSHVSLTIYNLAGQLVATLVNEKMRLGSYEINYSTQNLPSGIYVCRLNFGKQSLSSKIVLVK